MRAVGLGIMMLGLVACSQEEASLQPAPVGELEVLQSLADSYSKISEEKLTVSPMSLPGDERKRFLEQVFADSGYDYSATLHAMAGLGVDKENPLHRDLAELLLIPHRHQKYPMDPADIYSSEELQDVAALERGLKH